VGQDVETDCVLRVSCAAHASPFLPAGMHLFDFTLLDLFYCAKLIRKGGYLVVDDVKMPAVAKVRAYVETNRYDLEMVDVGVSTVFVCRKLSEDIRAWNIHSDF